ncbi:MAG: serine/threonine-protein kinase [Polyangiaceae bacterium]
MPLSMGSIIDGRYRILRRAGGGGFGEVFEAEQVALGTTVALKTILLPADPSGESRAQRVALLLDEAALVSKLRHPNVVSALDAGVMEHVYGPMPYLVLEWCPGATLADELAGAPRRSLDETWRLVEPIALALAHAHDMGIVHRDLKPSNIMLERRDGRIVPRLIDFGIAKAFEADVEAGSGQTRTGSPTSPHTPAYAAPEQVVGARTGPWTDVHALALLFVEILTGRRPYATGIDAPAVSPERPTPAVFGVDAGAFEPVLERALALRPRDRFPNARAQLEALAEAARTMGLSHAPLEPHASPPLVERVDPFAMTELAPLSATAASSRIPRLPPGAGPRPSRRAALITAALTLAGLGVAGYAWRSLATASRRTVAHLGELRIDDLEARLQHLLGTDASPMSWEDSNGAVFGDRRLRLDWEQRPVAWWSSRWAGGEVTGTSNTPSRSTSPPNANGAWRWLRPWRVAPGWW